MKKLIKKAQLNYNKISNEKRGKNHNFISLYLYFQISLFI